MSENDLISIIIPIYNVEKYLKECLDSILGQTYKNLEIILVDDGSPDNCGNICDEYLKKDSRIKVIHKTNGGLSDARNHGINIATGEYICFVDSDDYVDKYYVEKLYNAIKSKNLKLAQCNILNVNNQKDIIEKLGYDDYCIKSGKEIIREQYGKHVVENTVVWNKIYKKELFTDIRFPIGKIHEDEFVTYKILYTLDKVAIINDYLYNYRENDNSITKKKFNLKRLDCLIAYKEKIFFFKGKDEDIFIKALIKYIDMAKMDYLKGVRNISNFKDIEKDFLKEYRKVYMLLIRQKKISIKYKLKNLLFAISPDIYLFIKNKQITKNDKGSLII